MPKAVKKRIPVSPLKFVVKEMPPKPKLKKKSLNISDNVCKTSTPLANTSLKQNKWIPHSKSSSLSSPQKESMADIGLDDMTDTEEQRIVDKELSPERPFTRITNKVVEQQMKNNIQSNGGSDKKSKNKSSNELVNQNDCEVCNQCGELLLCDYCPKAYHLGCVGITAVPTGVWSCPQCVRSAETVESNGIQMLAKKMKVFSEEQLKGMDELKQYLDEFIENDGQNKRIKELEKQLNELKEKLRKALESNEEMNRKLRETDINRKREIREQKETINELKTNKYMFEVKLKVSTKSLNETISEKNVLEIANKDLKKSFEVLKRKCDEIQTKVMSDFKNLFN